ncbi:MAG: aldose 1-epimerase family protein [Nocardioidaceae bacterium]
MPEIFGLALADALPRVGSLAQVARVESLVETDGPGRGTRRLRVVNGGGLELDLLPDRALDIGAATYDGVPLAWLSSTGFAGPGAYEPAGRGWLRTFGGGLLTTCGLDSFGPPADDEDGVAGMHGRIGRLPAQVTRAEASLEGITVSGVVRQTAVFAENLVLRRTISTDIGSSAFRVQDNVTNEGSSVSPHMVLYHVNLGWPLLDEGSVVEIPHAAVEPRDADAASGLRRRYDVGAPVPGFREQVFIHHAASEHVATVTNEARGLRLTLRYSETLPALFQWKMTAPQHYVLGLEPANTPEIQGREAARASGRLPRLDPGQSVDYRVDFEMQRL